MIIFFYRLLFLRLDLQNQLNNLKCIIIFLKKLFLFVYLLKIFFIRVFYKNFNYIKNFIYNNYSEKLFLKLFNF